MLFEPKENPPPPLPKDMLAGIEARRCAIFEGKGKNQVESERVTEEMRDGKTVVEFRDALESAEESDFK